MRTLFWASKLLRKGGFVRRDSWVGNAYVYLCVDSDGTEQLYMNWINRKCRAVKFNPTFKDMEATDWEEFVLSLTSEQESKK